MAEERAISEPEPIALPASEATRAVASFVPSPTIATIARPGLLWRFGACDCSQLIFSAFSDGRTPAMMFVGGIPTEAATFWAVVRLSPVIIQVVKTWL